MQILQLLKSGSEKLKKNEILTHELDSELLLSSILKKKREKLILRIYLFLMIPFRCPIPPI